MSDFKKLFQAKRILAMMLAAVMVVTMLPTTANAASVNPTVTDSTQETTDASEPETETGTVPEETTSVSETGTDAEIPAADGASADEGLTEGEETETPAADGAEDDTAAVNTYTIVDELDASAKTAVYNGYGAFDATDFSIAYDIKIQKNGYDYTTLYNANTISDLANITTAWKVKKGDTYEQMADGEAPTNVGNYQLVITIPEVTGEGGNAKAEAAIDFTITKAQLKAYASIENVKPGTKAGDITVDSLYAQDEDGDFYYSYTPDANSELSFTKTVKNAITGEAVADDAVLGNNGDYAVELQLAFTDKVSAEMQANFELQTTVSVDVAFSDLIETEVIVTLGDKWKDAETGEFNPISKTYDGAAMAEPVKGEDYTVKVQYASGTDDSGNPVYTEITDAVVTGVWTDYADDSILETAPVDAGTYGYTLKYEGKEGVYEASSAQIEVEIKSAELTIRPKLSTDAKFYAGTTVKEVLAAVDYDVYDAAEKVLEIDRNGFWGTSYDNSYRTQPYEPIFKVRVEAGEQIVDDQTVPVYEDMYDTDTLQSGKTYQIVFTGKKGVYSAAGQPVSSVPINSSVDSTTDNYTVAADEEILAKYTVALTADAGTVASISADAIFTGDAKNGASYDNPITKVYDTKALYEKRADYKKAVVTADGKTIAKDTDSGLTYTWYKQTGTTSETDPETGVTTEEPVWSEATYRYSPEDAGNYKLEISYKDSQNVYHAAPVAVYYRIEKQKVKVVPVGDYTALTGVEIDLFLSLTDIAYEIYTVPEAGKEAEKLEWNPDYYSIVWDVEKQTDAEKNTWISAYGDTFEKDTAYRLAVGELELSSGSLYNNYVNYEIVTEGEGDNQTEKTVYLNDTKDITIKEMGTTELAVVIDETKLTTKTKVYDGTALDISGDIANGLIRIVAPTGTVTDAAVIGLWYDETTGELVEAPINAGTYTFYVAFFGDEKYKAFDGIVLQTTLSVTITPRELTVTPYVENTEVVAGTYYYSAYSRYKTVFDNVADRDKEAFTYGYISEEDSYGWLAADWLEINVYDAAGNQVYDKLTGVAEYTVKCDDILWNEPFDRNYTWKSGEVKITTVRGNSTVYGTSESGVEQVAVKDAVSGLAHTVTVKEGIPYSYDVYNQSTGEFIDGNLIAVGIRMPEEYDSMPDSVIYANSIKAAGGFNAYVSGNFIVAVFDASAKDKKEFDIRWEDGYAEHFTLDFTSAELLADLEKAVAPKTIAFNSPVTKMVVGGTQTLDVKLTKVQESDIIRLSYEVDQKDVLCVNAYGYVTALAEGTATVTVYASKQVDGKLVPIEPAKKATVKITVKAVTAPKIKKATATDEKVSVSFTAAYDGYRMEYYVLEGKNKTAADFEAAISSVKNGISSGIFATAPVYGYGAYVDKNTREIILSGLKANTDYTVYARNVSAIHTLSDGCKVTESHAGAVKSFTTTKAQVKRLDLNFEDQKTNYDYDLGSFTVKLSEGTTTATTYGYFKELAENAAADATDGNWYSLPLTKDQQKSYVNPKLSYYVGKSYGSNQGSEGLIGYFDGIYLYKTSLASVDKKGKIKLNGVGAVTVVVYDTNTKLSAYTDLYITAAADSITGKNVKLQVGQSISLKELLVYKEGKKVLTGSFAYSIDTDSVKKALEGNEYFELNGSSVTAIKAGGRLDLTLKDVLVGKEATTKLASTVLEPVKNLKASVITDQYFDLEFTHAGYAEAFRIKVTDASGNLLRSAYVPKVNAYDEASGKYIYRMTGLTKKSKYNIVVTALYRDEVSKEAKKSIQTTLLPASYVSLGKEETGGVDIYVAKTNGATTSITSNYIVSGNTYTLVAGGKLLNNGSKYATTDTLTWTSSDNKVATVKANPGTYTATLKAVKAGTTTIEVKSKITKAVIARYKVTVNAVGNAYSYYGENEALERNEVADSIGSCATLTLGTGVAVSAASGSYKWLAFTAPASGTYKFYSDGTDDVKAWYFRNMNIGDTATSSDLDKNAVGYNDDGNGYPDFALEIYLSAGQTIYVAVGHCTLSRSVNTTVYVEWAY